MVAAAVVRAAPEEEEEAEAEEVEVEEKVEDVVEEEEEEKEEEQRPASHHSSHRKKVSVYAVVRATFLCNALDQAIANCGKTALDGGGRRGGAGFYAEHLRGNEKGG